MGSIVEIKRLDKRTGKTVTAFRAYVRRTGFKSKSKVCATKREAQDWMRNNEADAALEKRSENEGVTFSKVVELFVAAPPMRGTKYWSPEHLDFWKQQFGNRLIGQITHGEINAGAAVLQLRPAMRATASGVKETDKPLTPATVNRYLASLSAVFNYALKRGIVDSHPMKAGRVEKLPESNGRTRILTAEEERRLYESAEASTWSMMGLFLRVCLTTGARKSEVLGLQWRNVDIGASIAMLYNTKNGDHRAIPLVSDVKAMLQEAKKVRQLASDYVFFDPRRPERAKNITEVWKHVRIRAGLWKDREDVLDRVVLHTTRHTVATKLIREEKNIAKVQNVTGHKTLSQLQRYTHLDTEDAVALAERALGNKSA